MRPLSELIDTEDPAWPEVQEWIAGATNPVEVLPVDRANRDSALLAIQVTTRSPMAAGPAVGREKLSRRSSNRRL